METAKLLSDFQGEITQILIVDPNLVFPRSETKERIEQINGILKSFEMRTQHRVNRVKVLLLTADLRNENTADQFGTRQSALALLENCGNSKDRGFELDAIQIDHKDSDEVIRFESIKHFARYIRDFLLIQVDELGNPILLQHGLRKFDTVSGGENPDRIKLDLLFNKLVEEHGFRKSKTTLVLAGGDVLAGSGFAIVGSATINDNRQYFNGDIDKTLNGLASTLGVKEIYYPHRLLKGKLPHKDPPLNLFHLDIFVAILGTVGERILVVVGKIYELVGGTWVRSPMRDPEQKYLQKIAASFSNITGKKRLFKVHRLPLFRIDEVLYSHCNCLVESSSNGKKVVIAPLFHSGFKGQSPMEGIFKDADNRASKAFRAMGYEMIGVDGFFHDNAYEKAGLRCLTQVLRRSAD